MDIASVTSIITGLKTAGDLINGILKAKTSDAINAAVREANSHLLTVQRELLSAQSEQLSMIEEIRSLKEKIVSLKAWESEKKRYQLYTPWNGAVVYALKKSMSDSEPPHWICTNCYEDGKKSILTQQKKGNGFIAFVCPRCKAEFQAIGRHSKGFSFVFIPPPNSKLTGAVSVRFSDLLGVNLI